MVLAEVEGLCDRVELGWTRFRGRLYLRTTLIGPYAYAREDAAFKVNSSRPEYLSLCLYEVQRNVRFLVLT